MTALTTIMRRAGGISEQEQLERLYCNMGPEYKMYIRFDDVATPDDLRNRVAKLEKVEQERKEWKAKSEKTSTPADASPPSIIRRNVVGAVNSEDTRLDCKRPPKRFCFRCGKNGVLTRDCHPPAGNVARRPGRHGPRLGVLLGCGVSRRRSVPDPIRVEYLPRPHVRVRLHQRTIFALLDSGSEVSLINTETAQYAYELSYTAHQGTRSIQMADGGSTPISTSLTLPVTIGHRMYDHDFLVVPSAKRHAHRCGSVGQNVNNPASATRRSPY